MNLSEPGEQVPDITEKDNTYTSPNELTGNIPNVLETETLPANATDSHITESPPSSSLGEPAQSVNETIEGDTYSQNDTILNTTLNTTTEMVDTGKTNESSELNNKLLGVTKPGNGIMPTVNPVPDTTINATEEPMDVNINNELACLTTVTPDKTTTIQLQILIIMRIPKMRMMQSRVCFNLVLLIALWWTSQGTTVN